MPVAFTLKTAICEVPSPLQPMPLLPMPGSPASSWAVYRARLKAVFHGADPRVCAAFWLFGMHAPEPSMRGSTTAANSPRPH